MSTLKIINLLQEINKEILSVLEPLSTVEIHELEIRLDRAVAELDSSSSQSAIGYHATYYLKGFSARGPNNSFDQEWGPVNFYTGKGQSLWRSFTYEQIESEVAKRSGIENLDHLEMLSKTASAKLTFWKSKLESNLYALLSFAHDDYIKRIAEEVDQVTVITDQSRYIERWIWRGPMVSRDLKALSGGAQLPLHLRVKARYKSCLSPLEQGNILATLAKKACDYLDMRGGLQPEVISTETRVFIGHGRSPVWRELKDFIVERLGLQYDEFNRESVAGINVQQRLIEMLDTCTFSFLVLTAEDIQHDESVRARQNVVHEAGLFQGRYGFRRSIILLEDGCELFSNVNGLTYISFVKGNIASCFEDVRRVLEREQVLVV